MQNLKLNIERVVNSIEGQVTAASLKEAIESFESTYTFIDSYEEAEKYFEESEIEGNVSERINQRLHKDDFEIVINEYYVDPGSIDYIYSVHVFEK